MFIAVFSYQLNSASALTIEVSAWTFSQLENFLLALCLFFDICIRYKWWHLQLRVMIMCSSSYSYIGDFSDLLIDIILFQDVWEPYSSHVGKWLYTIVCTEYICEGSGQIDILHDIQLLHCCYWTSIAETKCNLLTGHCVSWMLIPASSTSYCKCCTSVILGG